jgi:hypothetical protein
MTVHTYQPLPLPAELDPYVRSFHLGALLHNGGFGARYNTQEGLEAYALLGPANIKGGIPTKGGIPSFGSRRRLAGKTWHEFSHTVVNRLTQAHWGQLKALDHLIDPIAEQMDNAGYGSEWAQVVVNEHVIRAIEIRLAYRQFGTEARAEKLKEEKENGFRYVEPLARELKAYENNRDKYPTLADFYPRLVDVFENVAAGSQ